MEKWVSVYGFPNYEVSNFGRLKRIKHVAHHARYGKRNLQERFLNPKKNHDGYWRVRIGGKFKFVHVLVLESFVCPRPTGMQCCHSNGDSSDNRLENLRWDSPANNVSDRKIHGTYQWGSNNHRAKLTNESVINIRTSSEKASDLAKSYGVSIDTIYCIKRKGSWSHV